MSAIQSTKTLRHSLRRAASSSPKLPDEKLRVLVNLYHQAGTFITKENLSQAIDQAFIDPSRLRSGSQLDTEAPFRHLENELSWRRSMPKFGRANTAVARSNAPQVKSGQMWSEVLEMRELAVMTTLYGVLARGRPGLDAIRDEEERVKRELAEEKVQSS
ncbi:hypothetical protein C2E23DRAFT_867741 [Lenzites betulinus]|nr:hypothetical protein C2E23DRAFT_867741 [Lenzites betulinus]